MDARIEMRRGRYTPVVVSHDLWPWPETLVATDLSPWGLFIATERIVEPQEYVRLSFRLGTDELWEYEAYVVRSQVMRRQSDLGFSGFGVMLLEASEGERRRMRELLQGVPPPIPRDAMWRGTDAGGPTDRRRPGRRGGRRKEDRPKRPWFWLRKFSRRVPPVAL